MTKPKILMVVQRCGKDVNGGSEVLARSWANRLSSDYCVTVATTCAKDDASWENFFDEGVESDERVWIHRFKVDEKRNLDEFSIYSHPILSYPRIQDRKIQEEWMVRQGPISTTLFRFLELEAPKFQFVIFFTYLYATTVLGMRKIPPNIPILLVPTAHDEPPIYLSIYQDVFHRPDMVLFLTDAEAKFCHSMFPDIKKWLVVGCGIDVPKVVTSKTHNHSAPFFLYVGRIAPNKGCGSLFKNYMKLSEELRIPLVFMGRQQMSCPEEPYFQYKGFVPEEERNLAIRQAKAVIIPSQYESFSFSTLEAWAWKTPVLVNGDSPVLVDHVYRSGGGLVYRDRYEGEFQQSIQFLLENPQWAYQMGEKGYAYVKDTYSWDAIDQKLKDCLQSI